MLQANFKYAERAQKKLFNILCFCLFLISPITSHIIYTHNFQHTKIMIILRTSLKIWQSIEKISSFPAQNVLDYWEKGGGGGEGALVSLTFIIQYCDVFFTFFKNLC